MTILMTLDFQKEHNLIKYKNKPLIANIYHMKTKLFNWYFKNFKPSSHAKSEAPGLNPPAAVEGTTSIDVTDEKWPELAMTASVLTGW